MASANRSVGNIYDNSLVLEFERKPAASTERQPSLNHRKSVDSVEGTANSASELLQSHISNEDIWKRLESLQPVGKENGGYEAVVNPKLLTFAKQKPIQPPRLPKSLPERLEIEELLSDGYASVSSDADVLRREFELIQILQKTQKPDNPDDRVDRNELSGYLIQLDRLSKGRIASVISPQPPPVRALARMIETNGNKGIDLIIDDLTLTAQWLVSEGEADNGMLRHTLLKRVHILDAALPTHLRGYAQTALMHVEHEILERPYVNDETMLGDQVSDIPRSNFWASEDGYAWDMEELAAALSANGGVMRNPLSRELFSPEDVRSIVQHPLGGHLGALQVQQAELVKGLRQSTIERLSQLSKLLLEDQSLDSIPSRRGIDEFLNYLASLPASEQKAVDMLRVPARDSHTGQAYDWSIGDALRDGQANKVCLHKTGDFIGQAATHLKLQR